MKICRNGVGIELTYMELMDAANEYMRKDDVESIMAVVDYYDSEDDFMDEFGINPAVLEDIADECAERYRDMMNEEDVWFDNAEQAIRAVVKRRGLAV